MGVLTTHVLDTSAGKPANRVQLDLYRADGARRCLHSAITNQDGCCDQPLLQGEAFLPGEYELVATDEGKAMDTRKQRRKVRKWTSMSS